MFKNIQNISKETEMRLFIFASSTVGTWFIITMVNGYMSGACH